MTTINLREYYYWYTQDGYIEVSDEVSAELSVGKQQGKISNQRMRRNKSFYSLDAGDGIETEMAVHPTDSPDVVIEKKEGYCRLCRALNSLPEKQGRRIDAHYLRGVSVQKIAEAEDVGERNIRKSISRGLESMKIFLKNTEWQGTESAEK